MFLSMLVACMTPPVGDSSVEVPTFDPGKVVVEAATSGGAGVGWSGQEECTNFVEFGPTEDYGFLAPAGDGLSPHAVILGMKASSTVHFRLLAACADGLAASEDQVTTMPPKPAGVPTLAVETLAEEGLYERYVLLPTLDTKTGIAWLVVYDWDGDPVWWEEPNAPYVSSARRSVDGRSVVYRTDDFSVDARGYVRTVAFDHSDRKEQINPLGHHDLVVLPEGGFATIEADVRSYAGEDVVGDAIVEYDANGVRRVVWSSWDDLPVTFPGGDVVPASLLGLDWTHMNGLAYDAAADRFLVSSYWLDAVFAVGRSSGALEWQLGGVGSDFVLADGEIFGPAHGPVAAQGGLWLFDNHTMSGPSDPSRVIRIELDEVGGSAEVAWAWEDPQGKSTSVLGDVEAMADGSMLTTWGPIGDLVVLGKDGREVFHLALGAGLLAGRGEMFRSFYGLEDPVLPTE